jgi:hypothetical protein
MPRSNKRTASVPSSCPVGLWSCCSAPLGSLPLGPHQAPAPCWIHAPQGSLPLELRWAPALHWIYNPLGSLPLGPPAPRALKGPSSTWDDWIHALTGSLALGTPTLQALPGPSSTWDRTPQTLPDHRPARIPTPQGSNQLGVNQPHSLPWQEPHHSG